MAHMEDDYAVESRVARDSVTAAPVIQHMNHPVRVWIGSFNVNAKTPIQQQVDSWLNVVNTQADIYVVGFQEICNLNVINVGIMPNHSSGPWERAVANALTDSPTPFLMLFSIQLVGLLLVGFVREELFPYVKHYKEGSVATGFLGVGGNKGGIGCRFNLYDTSFCFVSAHLTANIQPEKVIARNKDYVKICDGLKFIATPETQRYPGQTELSIFDHDNVFWFGDLNYRINGDGDFHEIHEHIVTHDIDWLLERDQLTLERKAGRVFQNWCEGEICFAPTYKFQPGTVNYERRTGKKCRGPAWCDRILYYKHPEKLNANIVELPLLSPDDVVVSPKSACEIELQESGKFSSLTTSPVENSNNYDSSSDSIEQIFYMSHYSTLSDHVPVSSLFQCVTFSNPLRFSTDNQGSIWDYFEVVHFLVMEMQLSIGGNAQQIYENVTAAVAISAGAVDQIFKNFVFDLRSALGSPVQDVSAVVFDNLESGMARFALYANLHPHNLFITTLLSGLLAAGIFLGGLLMYTLIGMLLYPIFSYFRTARAFRYPMYYIRGVILHCFLMFFYALMVTAVYQLTLKDNWIFYFLAVLVLGPIGMGMSLIPAVFLYDKATYYDTFKNLANSLMYGIYASQFKKPYRLWAVVRCFYLLLIAIFVAVMNENLAWTQISLIYAVQIVYTGALIYCRPYHDKSVMASQIFMHVERIVTLTFVFFFLSGDMSFFTLMYNRYCFHAAVLGVHTLSRFQFYIRDFFIYLFPNFCNCCVYEGWNDIHNLSTKGNITSSSYVDGDASRHKKAQSVASYKSVGSNMKIDSSKNFTTKSPLKTNRIVEVNEEDKHVFTTVRGLERYSVKPSVSNEVPVDELPSVPDNKAASSLPATSELPIVKSGTISSDLMKRMVSNSGQRLFGHMRSQTAGQAGDLGRNVSTSQTSLPPPQNYSIAASINEEEEDDGDDEDETSRIQRTNDFMQKLNFFQKFNSTVQR